MDVIQKILEIENFRELTPIQKSVAERKNSARDFIGISSTGSGKSHAFFMAVFSMINPELKKVQAIISVPTRELAYQLNARIKKLAKEFGVQCALCIGGTERKESYDNAQIVIGTPGRLKDLFLNEKTLRLDQADLLIIDEADMTMEFGFLEDIDEILSHMAQDTTIMVFSATIPEQLQPFLKKYLTEPEIVEISKDDAFSADIQHILVELKHKEPAERLKDVLKTIQPYVCLIFANSTREAAKVADSLRKDGFDLVELHGDLEARERQRAIREIQSQKKTYIVASDLASRGIDLEGITHVISLGLPKDLTFYHHRAGRTGRAGRDGMAITIYGPKDLKSIESLKSQGIDFQNMEIKNNQLVAAKTKRAKKRSTPLPKEVAHLSKKPKKVKPNYKKKHRQELEALKRKHRREMIRKEIQMQKKQRAIQKQREKRQG